MKLQEVYELFQQELSEGWEVYQESLAALDKYRGREIGNDEDKVNEIVLDIQKSFNVIHPHLNFMLKNYEFAKQAIQSYEKFIDDIKRAGAVPESEIKA